MHPKPFTSKYVQHGIKYEPVALHEYEKFMKNRNSPVVVLKCGLIVCEGNSILAATPDAKVIDVGCVKPFDLAEVKCPQTKFHVTPLDACSDTNFCLQRDSDDKCKLKRSHSYYKQVQGQMGIAGAQWCDFIVYTEKVLHVERIAFDEAYWTNSYSTLFLISSLVSDINRNVRSIHALNELHNVNIFYIMKVTIIHVRFS